MRGNYRGLSKSKVIQRSCETSIKVTTINSEHEQYLNKDQKEKHKAQNTNNGRNSLWSRTYIKKLILKKIAWGKTTRTYQ